MAYLETTHVTTSSPSWIDRIADRFDRAIKAAQYGKMLQVMTALSDEQLEQIGLQRSEIPLHAHQAIYGTKPR
jgi:hypothetical protein